MKIVNFFLKALGNSVTNIQIKHNLQATPRQIILLDEHTTLHTQSICIGGLKEIIYTVKNHKVPNDVLFFSCTKPDVKPYAKPNINLIETNLDLITLYNKLNNALLVLKDKNKSSESETSFDFFFKNIVSMKLADEDEIKADLYELGAAANMPYNIIVIEANDPEVFESSFDSIKKELLNIFSEADITMYAKRMVIMYHHSGRFIRLPDTTLAAFNELLSKYNAHAGISNHTHNFEMIRTEYIIAKRVLQICKRMFPNTKRRIFTQEEHGTFYIMDLCYRQYEQTFHHNNMLYLCHPGLAALIRYDEKHNTNLRKVLMYYLLNDRSLAKTSKLLYMHRNTTMNKVNRIGEIIDDDLDDPLIRQRLLFSCLLYDYCEKYKQKGFTLLDPEKLNVSEEDDME